jgi:hypothetical protein
MLEPQPKYALVCFLIGTNLKIHHILLVSNDESYLIKIRDFLISKRIHADRSYSVEEIMSTQDEEDYLIRFGVFG